MRFRRHMHMLPYYSGGQTFFLKSISTWQAIVEIQGHPLRLTEVIPLPLLPPYSATILALLHRPSRSDRAREIAWFATLAGFGSAPALWPLMSLCGLLISL